MMKKFLTGFSILISLFLFTSSVKAKELSQFKENGFEEITTELIDEIISKNNVDTSFNDSYLLVAFGHSNNITYHLILFNSENMKNGVNYIDTTKYFTFKGTDIINTNTSYLSIKSNLYLSTDTWLYGITNSIPENAVYYATTDILDQDGNVFLAKNSEDVVIDDPFKDRTFKIIDITKFFIVKKDEYTRILSDLNITIDESSANFYPGYVLTNIFAYLIIVLFIKSVITVYYMMFKKKRGVS